MPERKKQFFDIEFEKEWQEKMKKERMLSIFIPIILTAIFSIISFAVGYKIMVLSESIVALAFWAVFTMFVINFIFRERLVGRAVVVSVLCMENTVSISSGCALIVFFSGLSIWCFTFSRDILICFSIIFLILSIALLFKGFFDGPVYGWFE